MGNDGPLVGVGVMDGDSVDQLWVGAVGPMFSACQMMV